MQELNLEKSLVKEGLISSEQLQMLKFRITAQFPYAGNCHPPA